MSKEDHGAALLACLKPSVCSEPPDPRAVYHDMRPVVRHAEALIAERDRARAYIETQRLCGRFDAVLVTVTGEAAYNAALADEPKGGE